MGRGYVKYRPDRPADPASEAQVQAMNAKLAARVKEVADTACSLPLQAAQSPQAKSEAKLEWEKPVAGATGVKTKCKRYACAKVTVDGKTHYELSKLVPGGEWYVRIDRGSGLDNFLQAQTLAQQDADK